MVEMTSPGVYVSEVDASEIVPTVSSSTAVFGGDFTKGPVERYTEITSVDDLIEFYGLPTNLNYNDWYQCYNFLQYGNRLLISRACNLNGYPVFTSYNFVALSSQEGYGTVDWGLAGYGEGVDDEKVVVDAAIEISAGDVICFVSENNDSTTALNKGLTERYFVVEVGTKTETDAVTGKKVKAIKLDRNLDLPATEKVNNPEPSTADIIEYYLRNKNICFIKEHHNGSCEALQYEGCITENANNNSGLPEITWKRTSVKYLAPGSSTVSSKYVGYTVPVVVPKSLDGSDLVAQITVEPRPGDTDNPVYYTLKTQRPTRPDSGVLFQTNIKVLNPDDFDYQYDSGAISFANANNSKLKFFSRTPGTAPALYTISVALPQDFAANDKKHVGNHCTRYVHEGVSVDSLFEYAPAEGTAQIAVVIYDIVNQSVKEAYLCSLNPEDKDNYGNSMFIEKVINRSSNCVYVKCNTDLPATYDRDRLVSSTEEGGWEPDGAPETVPNVGSYTLVCDYEGKYHGQLLTFHCASDSEIQEDDLLNAYEVFENKDLIDVDIVIGNELDDARSAKALSESRRDCITFMGIPYEHNGRILAVSRRSAEATTNIVNYRNAINYNTDFVSLNANYKYQYDRYNDTYRWINVAGDVAGLRAKTNQEYDAWWASAGLNRGQIKNVVKLAYNPNQTQRSTLYTNGINPIVDFPGQGVVLWGQKTMLDKASSFDRVNVRSLFCKIERALARMSKYQVMEFNDTFTRNRIIAIMKPYLATVQAGRGIQDFMIICDTTNNTPDVISRNQLVVDIYIKPTFVAEMLHLNFINCGVNDFSTIVSSNLT